MDNSITNKYIEIIDNIDQGLNILEKQKDKMCYEDFFLEYKRLKKMSKQVTGMLNNYGITVKAAAQIKGAK